MKVILIALLSLGTASAFSPPKTLSRSAAATFVLRSRTVNSRVPLYMVEEKKSSISKSTFNLAKNIIGAGVLSLPNGVAYFSDAPTAIIPSVVLCTVMGLISAYSFSLIGKACEMHKTNSLQETWAKSVDPKSAPMLNSAITVMCLLSVLAYSIIIGDSFTALAKAANLPPLLATRTNVILIMTSVVLFPLCSMGSLTALTPFSLLGLGGVLYTAFYMLVRFFDKSYLPGGQFFSTVAAARPLFSTRPGSIFNPKALVLLSMLGTSYIAHFNAPKFYNELENTSMKRFNRVVAGAFGISMALFALIMTVGFLSFGSNTLGFILNNYAATDGLATLARLAIGGAILTSYPFAFSAFRDGIFDLFKFSGEKRKSLFRPLTIGLLGVVTVLALVLKDVGFVNSISGSLFGPPLLLVIPALMNIQNSKRTEVRSYGIGNRKSVSAMPVNKLEMALNYAMIPIGIVLTFISLMITLQKA